MFSVIVAVALAAVGTALIRRSQPVAAGSTLPVPVQKSSGEPQPMDSVKSFAALQVVADKLRETYDEEMVRSLIDPIVPLLLHKKK